MEQALEMIIRVKKKQKISKAQDNVEEGSQTFSKDGCDGFKAEVKELNPALMGRSREKANRKGKQRYSQSVFIGVGARTCRSVCVCQCVCKILLCTSTSDQCSERQCNELPIERRHNLFFD